MIHEFRTNTECFEAIISGKKTFTIIGSDRNVKVHDLLALNEYDQDTRRHTGNSCVVYVDYIQEDACVDEGYVCMSIKPCVVWAKEEPFDRCRLTTDYSVPYATKGDGVE